MTLSSDRSSQRTVWWSPSAMTGGSSDGQRIARQLDQCLRGEYSAIESYDQVLKALTDGGEASEAVIIGQIRRDHLRQVAMLREQIEAHHGEPSDGSGAWGLLAHTVMSTAIRFGSVARYKALKEGEEHGLSQYRQALEELNADSATLVKRRLIPATLDHIDRLTDLITRQTRG